MKKLSIPSLAPQPVSHQNSFPGQESAFQRLSSNLQLSTIPSAQSCLHLSIRKAQYTGRLQGRRGVTLLQSLRSLERAAQPRWQLGENLRRSCPGRQSCPVGQSRC